MVVFYILKSFWSCEADTGTCAQLILCTECSISLLIFCFWSTFSPTWAPLYHWEQNFSLHLASMLLLLSFENEWSHMCDGNNAGLLSCGVLECDWTWWTVWIQIILMEWWQNRNMMPSVNWLLILDRVHLPGSSAWIHNQGPWCAGKHYTHKCECGSEKKCCWGVEHLNGGWTVLEN